MSQDVPARPIAALREKGVTAGNVFFGMDLIQFKGGFIAFVRNRKQTDAMDGAGGSAKVRCV